MDAARRRVGNTFAQDCPARYPPATPRGAGFSTKGHMLLSIILFALLGIIVAIDGTCPRSSVKQ